MEEKFLKCDEVQLRLLLYGLMHLKPYIRCSDVLLDPRNFSRYNELLQNIILCLPLSVEDAKFYSSYQFKLNNKGVSL